jgi:hypothetical protein
MSSATERSPHGDWALSVPSLATPPEPVDSPEWHSLRLFGSGRHPRAFDGGAEKQDEL